MIDNVCSNSDICTKTNQINGPKSISNELSILEIVSYVVKTEVNSLTAKDRLSIANFITCTKDKMKITEMIESKSHKVI